MGKSNLIDITMLSPNNSGKRTEKISRITPHCFVGMVGAERIGKAFQSTAKQASCNYGIGFMGDVVEVVPENMRSWCSSSRDNDQRAVTIECASDKNTPYDFSVHTYDKLVTLCADICLRNGKKELLWIPKREKALAYNPKEWEMIITLHRWFANKSCPGEWLVNRLYDFAATVTAKINDKQKTDYLYKVQVGAFSKRENAEKLLNKLQQSGYSGYIKMEGR